MVVYLVWHYISFHLYKFCWVSTAYIPFLELTTVKYHKLCGLNNRNVCFHSSAGSKLEIKVSTDLVLSDNGFHKKESALCLPNSFWWFTCNLLCSDVSPFFLLCVDVSLSCSLHLFMVLSVCLLVQKGPIVQKGSTVSGLVPKCCLISSAPQISTATLFPDKFKFSSQSFQHRNAGDTKFNP